MKKPSGNKGAPLRRGCLQMLFCMKLIFALITAGCLQASAGAYSQLRINLRVNNVPLVSALHEIEKNSNYRFVYNLSYLKPYREVTANMENVTIDYAMQHMLGQELAWRLLPDNLVVISPRHKTLQVITVKGRVTDEGGLPIVGATIRVKGGNQGTVTDANGNYTLVAPENAVLVISYIGFDSREIPLGGKTQLDVALQVSAKSLEQVVVVGYGTQRKKDITASISTVDASDFAGRPVVQMGQALSGKVPGVQVTENSGKPGSGIAIRVRGTTSINASNEPLFVIDGVPTNDIKGLSMDDIASMQVLKDAASAAIYGSRGANGVVLITTKRGKAGVSKVSFNTYHGFSQLPEKIGVLNGRQYAELINEAQVNAGGVPKYPDINAVQDLTDWQEEVYRDAPMHNYQLAFSGGSEKTQYYISVGYLDQQGIIAPTMFKRYNVRMNLDQRVTDWLKVGNSFTLSKTDSRDVTDNESVARGGVVLGALSTPPVIPIYKPDGTFSENPFQAWENPVATMLGPDDLTRATKVLGNVYAELNFTKDLQFRTSLGVESNSSKWNNFLDPYRTATGRLNKGLGKYKSGMDFIWLSENTLTWNKAFGRHRVTALGGFTSQQSRWDESYQELKNFPSANVPTGNAGVIRGTSTTDAREWSIASFIGRITYDFNSRYLVTLNLRHDGSSRFGRAHRWATFPSVSAGWRLSEEPFMQGIRGVVNDWKLRASWGITGNQPDDPYASYGKVITSGGYPFGEDVKPGMQQERATNDSLKWESTRQLDIGMDISLFDSRIMLTADLYFKRTNDLLMDVNVPTQSGVAKQLRNVGNVENKGFEIGLSTQNLRGSFTWNTDINFAVNRNKVINLGGPNVLLFNGGIYERGDVSIVQEGNPIGSFYGMVAKGVDPKTGMMLYEDLNNDNAFDDKDRRIIGNAQPRYTFGITNNLGYRNFDLSFFFQGVQGNKIFNATRIEIEGMENWKNQSDRVLARWHKEGDIAEVPKALADSKQNSLLSTRFLEDGSFIRLKAITLSYNFRNEWLRRLRISRLQLYATAQNLFTITNYSGYDPEISFGGNDANDPVKRNAAIGIDFGTYPQPRTYIMGLNVDFD